jgi:hypothetical protein
MAPLFQAAEGSLRSAVYVLHCILKEDAEGTSLSWLQEVGLHVETNYLKRLREWAEELDRIPGNDSYLYQAAEQGDAEPGAAPGGGGM